MKRLQASAPRCRLCDGSGWLVVELPSATRPGQTERRAHRCQCLRELIPVPQKRGIAEARDDQAVKQQIEIMIDRKSAAAGETR
jgi:hypothetical protein